MAREGDESQKNGCLVLLPPECRRNWHTKNEESFYALVTVIVQ